MCPGQVDGAGSRADATGVMRVALLSLLAAVLVTAAFAAPANAALPCLELVGIKTCVKTPGAYPKSEEACPGRDTEVTAATLATARRATLCLLNVERAQRGLKPLQGSTTLRRAAVAYAKRMARDDFFAHVGPGGDTLRDRVKRTSYLSGARAWALGENIAYGGGARSTPAQVVASWMASPGHKRNVLDAGFDHIGIGIATGLPVAGGGGGTYVTDFGSR